MDDVGKELYFENSEFKLWKLILLPGERFQFHKHSQSYSWTSLTCGKAISPYASGEIIEIYDEIDDMSFYQHSKQGNFIHDLQNIGETELIFTTLEYKDLEDQVSLVTR